MVFRRVGLRFFWAYLMTMVRRRIMVRMVLVRLTLVRLTLVRLMVIMMITLEVMRMMVIVYHRVLIESTGFLMERSWLRDTRRSHPSPRFKVLPTFRQGGQA